METSWCFIGIHECVFRVKKCVGRKHCNGLGVVPESKAVTYGSGYDTGYCYDSNGDYFSADVSPHAATRFSDRHMYGNGDDMTVRLDLEENTITFRKNSETVGEPQDIPNTAYHFMFDAAWASRVTIVKMT